MNKSRLLGAVCACLAVVSFNANAALLSRLGGATVYDTVLDITWLADASLGASESFGVESVLPGWVAQASAMTFAESQVWIAAMNDANYLGQNEWRLPATLHPDPTCSLGSSLNSIGYGCIGSEMGHLFYQELGGIAGSPVFSGTDPDLNLFSNIPSVPAYWSETTYLAFPGPQTWIYNFWFGSGAQSSRTDNVNLHVWPVINGDVFVPLPATPFLFVSGLLMLLRFRKSG